jgi:hypothetical protein
LPQFQLPDRQERPVLLELRAWLDPPESRLEPTPAGQMLFRKRLTGLPLQPRDRWLSFPIILSLFWEAA